MNEEFEIPRFMLYPDFSLSKECASPDIALPEDWETLLPEFVRRRGVHNLEDFVESLNLLLENASLTGAGPKIRLNWSEKYLGLLTNIQIGDQAGLEILTIKEDEITRYVPHNLGGLNGVYINPVPIRYINELLRGQK